MDCHLRAATLLFTASALGASLCCRQRRGADSFLQGEAELLQKRTIPAGSLVVSQSAPIQKDSSTTMTWEFETAWDSEKYKQWVCGQLGPEFEFRQAANSPLRFGRLVEGDAETVTIEAISRNGKLHVSVNLVTYPD